MSMITLPEPNTPAPAETAPSAVMREGPALARLLGFIGLFLVILGVVVVVATRVAGTARLIPESAAFMAAALGMVMMLYHAMSDGEPEVRRMYGGVAVLLLVGSLVISLVPGPIDSGSTSADRHVGYFLLPWGEAAALLGLFFSIAFIRQETEDPYRLIGGYVLLGVGGLLAVGSLAAGVVRPDFLAGPGITLGILGLGFLCAYLTHAGASEGLGYTVAVTLGAFGGAIALYAVARSIAPWVLYEGPSVLKNADQSIDTWKAFGRGLVVVVFLAVVALGALGRFPVWVRAVLVLIGLAGATVFVLASINSYVSIPPKPFLVPGGVILMGMGSVYVAVALGYCSDNQLVTLTRRELSAYFYSPIGFLVLGGMALAEWLSYVHFVGQITGAGNVPEPIVQFYFTEILILFLYVVQIPILTMRLLAEEKQTGSLEVLLTSPVNESTIVVGKFLATLIFYLVCWVPSGLFLIALREIGDQPFDYRPLLGFYIGLAAQGAMFISMGLFFSSITRNQVVAAVLTFDVLLGLLFVTLWRFNPAIAKLPDVFLSSFGRLSFYHMWLESLGGQLPIRDVLLALSLAVFGLFLTVKVLEIRKWS